LDGPLVNDTVFVCVGSNLSSSAKSSLKALYTLRVVSLSNLNGALKALVPAFTVLWSRLNAPAPVRITLAIEEPGCPGKLLPLGIWYRRVYAFYRRRLPVIALVSLVACPAMPFSDVTMLVQDGRYYLFRPFSAVTSAALDAVPPADVHMGWFYDR
jgi:hypothetical protein